MNETLNTTRKWFSEAVQDSVTLINSTFTQIYILNTTLISIMRLEFVPTLTYLNESILWEWPKSWFHKMRKSKKITLFDKNTALSLKLSWSEPNLLCGVYLSICFYTNTIHVYIFISRSISWKNNHNSLRIKFFINLLFIYYSNKYLRFKYLRFSHKTCNAKIILLYIDI